MVTLPNMILLMILAIMSGLFGGILIERVRWNIQIRKGNLPAPRWKRK